MELSVVNHQDYFAKIGDDHKFPINKFGELAKYLINEDIVKKFHKPYPCSEETLKKASMKKINPLSYLNANNSYEFFEKIDDLIFTSPTLTNVNDFRAVLVQP